MTDAFADVFVGAREFCLPEALEFVLEGEPRGQVALVVPLVIEVPEPGLEGRICEAEPAGGALSYSDGAVLSCDNRRLRNAAEPALRLALEQSLHEELESRE